MSSSAFLREAISNMKTVGSVRPSSPNLCRTMARPVNIHRKQTVIELGAGEGTITRHILHRMHPESRLLAFEINKSFLSALKKFEDQRMMLVNDSAEHLQKHLTHNKLEKADVIISALPLVLFDKSLARKIIHACHQALTDDGVFVQFHYSVLNKRMYEREFEKMKVKFVLNNLPPAFVFYCWKH